MAYAKIRPKRGTKSQWELANTVLAEGELGIEVPDAGIGKGQVKIKQGDGFTPWNSLPYAIDLKEFVEHLEDTENPHETTWEQVGAAPGGFGLGDRAPYVYDCNDVVKTGWYTVSGGTNCPADDTLNYGWMAVSVSGAGYVRQDFYTSTSTPDHFERYYIDGVWSDWVNVGHSAYAPAGFGLGDGAPVCKIEDIDNMDSCGWFYATSSSGYKVSGKTLYYLFVRVDSWKNSAGSRRVMQTAYNDCHVLQRWQKHDGTWNEWEWVNPPLVSDVEYRTTDRINGKAVYKKMSASGRLLYRLEDEETYKFYLDILNAQEKKKYVDLSLNKATWYRLGKLSVYATHRVHISSIFDNCADSSVMVDVCGSFSRPKLSAVSSHSNGGYKLIDQVRIVKNPDKDTEYYFDIHYSRSDTNRVRFLFESVEGYSTPWGAAADIGSKDVDGSTVLAL